MRAVTAPDAARPQYREGRGALLKAAARVIARKGFRGLTYRAVADEAGVTHGLVSYHFGSRDNLIHETIAQASASAIESSDLSTPSGQLEDFAGRLSRLVAEAPDDQAVQFELALEARRRAELLPEIHELYGRYVAIVHETLTRLGIDADPALARLVFAAVDGLSLQQLIFGRPEDTDASLAQLHRLLAPLQSPRTD